MYSMLPHAIFFFETNYRYRFSGEFLFFFLFSRMGTLKANLTRKIIARRTNIILSLLLLLLLSRPAALHTRRAFRFRSDTERARDVAWASCNIKHNTG